MPPPTGGRTFRLPRSTYLVVLFLLVGAIPLSFAGALHSVADSADNPATDVVLSWRLLFLLVPILAAVFIARTRTVVDAGGITVQALFGARRLPWSRIRGLSVSRRTVYAVCEDGAVRLPCVTVAGLAALSAASGGHLPQVAPATPKYAPARRPRRPVRPR